MESLYQHLSGHVYGKQVAGHVMIVAEGPVNREEMAALACVAKHCSVPFQMKYEVVSVPPTS